MPRPVSIYAYFLPRIFLEALSGSEACMPVAPIQRSGLNCHCPLAGPILMALLHRKKLRHSVRIMQSRRMDGSYCVIIFCRLYVAGLAPQQGHRGRIPMSALINRTRTVAIEFGMWRSGRKGGSSGSITFG